MKHILSIIGFVIIWLHPCVAQKPYLMFEHVSSTQGLSQSEVNCITQDSKGFIWIGTLNGLNRFDGYDMVVYKRNSQNQNSLSSNYIQSIFEDKQGHLWVGTVKGLNRYQSQTDGFYNFQNQVDSTNSNAKYDIRCIIQRKNGDLLLGTNKGLSVLPFNRINDAEPKFDDYLNIEIGKLIEDKDGFVWMATWEGLFKISFDEKGTPVILSHFIHNKLNPSGLSSDALYTLIQDKAGNLWIGTRMGVDVLPSNMLSTSNPIFIHYSNTKYSSLNYVKCIIEASTGQIFIGSRGGGLSLINKNKQDIFTYESDYSNNIKLSNNSVRCLFEDKTGVLWIGTLGGGCNKVNLYQKQFVNNTISLNNNTVNSNFIRSIYEDKNKTLWIGTLDGGLFMFNEKGADYTQFPISEGDFANNSVASNKTILGKRVFAIFEHDDKLWVGASGLNIINKRTGIVKHHRANYNNTDSLINSEIFSIDKDDDGSLWIGSWGALHHYMNRNVSGESYFFRYQNKVNDPNCISDNVIRYVYNDPLNSDMWVATMNGGINRLVRGSDKSIKFIQYKNNSKDSCSLSSNSTYMILRSKAGVIWVATDDGLNKLIPGNEKHACTFQKYNETDGLSGAQVKSILEDKNGNLWLGTNKGISKFNPSTKEFNNFDTFDGLLSSEFSDHSCFKNGQGKMYFGGVNGFTSFYPDKINLSDITPDVKFTNLFIFNKVVPVGKLPDGRKILEKPISETGEIELSYKDKVFAIEFSALHYAAPLKNKYAYRIEGVNDDWIYCDSKNRRATFTNMKGGTYILKVIGSNNDGVWQTTPAILKIKIRPPFWQTLPAYLTYLIILLLIIFAIIREVRSKERLQSDLALKNLEKEKADELTQLKLQFFTNISHEFRTPLTLIISPLENLIDSIKENKFVKDQLTIMQRNSKYLLSLVNELIDFRKAESGSLKLCASENNIVAFMHEIVSPFDEMSKRKSIKLNVYSEFPEQYVWFDKEMMIKVFNNLIYNALKFTSECGEIKVEIGKGDEKLETKFPNSFKVGQSGIALSNFVFIKIVDTGVGISPQSLSDIFNRFYQVGSSDSINHLGSGIGLALAKNLILINKGEIIVSSERYIGTEFIVCLPLGEDHLTEEEKVPCTKANEVKPAIDDQHNTYVNDQKYLIGKENSLPVVENNEEALILIVEDNDDMRNYLKSNLQRKYKIIEANNGVTGYDLAIEFIPDLIVSDVMMPEMNGVEMCRKLKTNIVTSHIPVVLLTALSSVSDQIEGLETGADDYISKPFNQKLFEIRVENLLSLRKKLRERFGKESDIKTKDFALNTRDQEFLDKAINLVKENISDTELSVDQLSKDLFMSRKQLFRKLKALTDQAPNEFIRTIRLKEAVVLLAENRYSISEIAYKVGFSAPSYFSTCFLKQFGFTPKDYISNQNEK